ncbi:GNAT family N-acetyltransferase [Thermolongibacillus altinsuensis]
MNFHIRSEKIDDYKGIREVNMLAFHREDEAKLVESIRESEYFIPELSLVAVTDEHEIIGHILFSEITLETDKENLPTLALAPMAVKPQYQRQGIGSRLVTEGLKVCKDLGYKHVFVLGHLDFYPRFGFVPAKTFGIESPFPVPDEVFMALELEHRSLDGLTGKIKYPKAFDTVS